MKTYGLDRFGELIARQCALARTLGDRIAKTPQLALLAPVTLNVVCFRYEGGDAAGLDAVNARIVVELQERGIAVPSTTRIGGKLAIRMNVMNHRSTAADLDAVIDAILDITSA